MRWRRRAGRTSWSLTRRLLVLQLIAVAVGVALAAVLLGFAAYRDEADRARDQSMVLAESTALDPRVREALGHPDPAAVLQPFAERIRLATGVDFVVVMSPEGVRYSHPDPSRLGQVASSDVAASGRDEPYVITRSGPLGRSVRAVAPIKRDGTVVGYVSVGVLTKRVFERFAQDIPLIVGLGAIGILIGGLLSLAVARHVKRLTLGLEPRDIARLYQQDQAVLHAIREGLLVVSPHERVVMANDQARRLLELPEEAIGRRVEETVLGGTPLRDLLASGREAVDELHVVGDRVLVVSQKRAMVAGRWIGSVTTLRDRTELESLSRELATVRGLSESLRAQAHESANRLHTIVGLVELGRYDDAVQLGVEEVEVAQEMLSTLDEKVREPALVALLVGKTAAARERGIVLRLTDDSAFEAAQVPPAALVTILGNLVDNAIDALAEQADPAPVIEVRLVCDGTEAVVEVRDNGPGLPPTKLEEVFEAGWTTKAADGDHGYGLGLALIRQTVRRLGGTVTAHNAGGAVFVVRLPLGGASPRAEPPMTVPSA